MLQPFLAVHTSGQANQFPATAPCSLALCGNAGGPGSGSALLSLELLAGCSALPEQVAEDMASDLYQITGYRKMNAIYKSTHGCAALTRISST
jgi:hypothetical protein